MTDFSISAPVALFTGAALLLVVLGLVALALDRRRVHRRQQRFQGLLEDLAHDRPGRIVKVTPTFLHIEWTAPSSGKTRVVPVGLLTTTSGGQIYPAQIFSKNVRVQKED